MTFHPRRSYRSDAPQTGSPVLERRYWPREPARDAEAFLTWTVLEKADVRIEARLVDLSRRGAAVAVVKPPARGTLLRLGLAADESTTVEGRVVAMRVLSRQGGFILHLKFTSDCPQSLFDRATGGGENEEGRTA